ncbi:25S rRNA (adenine2142-N1)-methyltransferase, partial [Lecanoromycetidae sp. Uapishka_2]
MAPKKKKKRTCLLSSTRPRNVKPKPTLSSQTTQKLVRNYHTLKKQLSSAIAQADIPKAEAIKAEIEAAGGLKRYQEASIQGQSAQRGGDTSKVLIEWLADFGIGRKKKNQGGRSRKLLEVGSLSPHNACSRSGIFEIKRIDLHSQHPDIDEQDFMTMPLPNKEAICNEGFDIVSLSLVVNFVSDAAQRGEMLRRVGSFFRLDNDHEEGSKECFPALFLVLPASCVLNSRYLNEPKLKEIMESLGYELLERKLSSKLAYYLWKYREPVIHNVEAFKKEELRHGRSRNNFAIVVQ